MAAATGAAELEGLPVAPHSPFPWWLKLAVVALMLSTLYTVAQLREHRFLAVFAALGGVFAAVAELRWIPLGQGGEMLAILSGVMPLVLGPLVLRWRPALSRWMWITSGSAAILAGTALGIAIWLQVVDGWQPCPLCWLQRIALILTFLFGARIAILGANRRVPAALLGSVLLGLFAVFLQLGEVHQAALHRSGFCSLLAHSSCAAAGSQMLGPWPIALDAGALFAVLFLLGFCAVATQPGEHDAKAAG